MQPSDVWGTVPAWISAVGSVFALVFAAFAVYFSQKTHRRELARDETNSELRTRGEAAKVSAWWGRAPGGNSWGFYIRNASSAPVYQAFVTILGADHDASGWKLYYAVVPPANVPEFHDFQAGLSNQDLSGWRVAISFTDSLGLRWSRNKHGSLQRREKNLCIKADPARVAVLSRFKDDFRETYGVEVTFERDPHNHPQSELVLELDGLSKADALVAPHDWAGDLAARGLIEPLLLAVNKQDAFPQWALAALTVDEKLYGIPTTMDTIGLVRNLELAPVSPTTMDELISNGEILRNARRVEVPMSISVGESGDPFQIWPLFTGAGGWLFRYTDGKWDTEVVGLDTEESISAFEQIRRLGQDGRGILDLSMDRQKAVSLFTSGQSPYLICDSYALKFIEATAINVGVSAVPPFDGFHSAPAFSLVHGLMVTAKGSNSIVAEELFGDYLSHEHVIRALRQDPNGDTPLRSAKPDNTAMEDFMALCQNGQPMPTLPQLNGIWRILERAEVALIRGNGAESTARRAAGEVRALLGGS